MIDLFSADRLVNVYTPDSFDVVVITSSKEHESISLEYEHLEFVIQSLITLKEKITLRKEERIGASIRQMEKQE